MNTDKKIELMKVLKAAFDTYGDTACLNAIAEAIECGASTVSHVQAERRVFAAAKAIGQAEHELGQVREEDATFPSIGDAFEVAIDITIEMDES